MSIYSLRQAHSYITITQTYDVADQEWPPLNISPPTTVTFGNEIPGNSDSYVRFFIDTRKIIYSINYYEEVSKDNFALKRDILIKKLEFFSANEINNITFWYFSDYINSLKTTGWVVNLGNQGFFASKEVLGVELPFHDGFYNASKNLYYSGSYDLKSLQPDYDGSDYVLNFNNLNWNDYMIYDYDRWNNILLRTTDFKFDIPITIYLPEDIEKFREWFAVDMQQDLSDIQITIEASATEGNQNEDIIVGSFGRLRAYGYGGTDYLQGGSGNDRLDGGDGWDVILGMAGNDQLIGGAGDPQTGAGDHFDGGIEGPGARVRDAAFFENIDLDQWYADAQSDSWSTMEFYGGDVVDYSTSSKPAGEQGIRIWIADLNGYVPPNEDGIAPGEGFGGDAEGDSFADIEHAIGTNEDDIIVGNQWLNVLDGRGGDDTMGGGPAPDFLFGGGGFDMAGYRYWDPNRYDNIQDKTLGVTVNLTDPTKNTFWARGDVFNSIEGLLGSDFNDKLVGNFRDNKLYGFKGNDNLLGGGGDDTLDGGPHSQDGDTVNYSNANLAVYVNISDTSRTIETGDPNVQATLNAEEGKGQTVDNIVDNVGTDKLAHFENIFGGGESDILLGNERKNLVKGNDGNDILNGYGANDTLFGAAGNDTIYGIDPSSTTTADVSGHNTVTGGEGDDTALWSGRYGDYDKVVSKFASFFVGNSEPLVIKNGSGDSSDKLADQFEHLKFADGEVSLFKIQCEAGFRWAVDSFFSLADAFFNILKNQEIPQKYEKYINWVDLTKNLAEKGWSASKALDKLFWKQVFIESHVLLVDALETFTGGKVPGSDEYTGVLYDALRDEVREGSAKEYDIIMQSLQDPVDKLGEWYGNWKYGVDIGDQKLKSGQPSEPFQPDVKTVPYSGLGNGDDDFTIPPPDPNKPPIILAPESNDPPQPELILSYNSVTDAGDGNNTVTGSSGNDYIIGGSGVDIIAGQGGNDGLVAGSGEGDDTYIGGPGIDFIFYPSTSLGVYVDLMLGVAYGPETGHDIVREIENVLGGSGDDTILGDAVANLLIGDPGDDILKGRANDDTVYGGSGNDVVGGGEGNDSLIGGPGDDIVIGGTGNDTIIGGGGNDSVDGGEGTDAIDYGLTTEGIEVDLSAKKDQATGTEIGTDQITRVENVSGGSGSDLLSGNHLANVLQGNAGNDLLKGHQGDDTLLGQNGDDTLAGGNGDDLLDGGDGDDDLAGGNGEDTLLGGDGNDMLYGSNGSDTLIAGAGDDTLTGGRGDDLFVFEDVGGDSRITDFKAGEGLADMVDVTAFGFANFSALLAATKQVGQDAVIQLDEDDTLTLQNIQIDQLYADGFL